MKDQYFGDVNDYRKYGLLRALQQHSGLRLGVWWMLTPNDDRPDGRKVHYLKDPDKWKRYDAELYTALRKCLRRGRRVSHVAEENLLPGSVFVDTVVSDVANERTQQFQRVRDELRKTELVFVDPDNGIEVASKPEGRKGSSKYVLWKEIVELFSARKSILIYQHFTRENRSEFVRRISAALTTRTGSTPVKCFRTPHVAFLLLRQRDHLDVLNRATRSVTRAWKDEILLGPPKP